MCQTSALLGLSFSPRLPKTALAGFPVFDEDLSKELFKSRVVSSLLKRVDLHGLAACFMTAEHLPPMFLPSCVLHLSEVVLYPAALWGYVAWSLKHLQSLLSAVITRSHDRIFSCNSLFQCPQHY